jgi:hypothetical protein
MWHFEAFLEGGKEFAHLMQGVQHMTGQLLR